MRLRHLFALSALALSTAACLEDFPDPDHLGLIVVRAHDNTGTAVLRGSGLFFQVGGLVLTPAVPLPCGLYSYSPTSGTVGGGSALNAGSSIGFTVGGSTQQASRAFIDYQMIGGTYLNFVTGDSVTITVPGANGGFQATTAKMRLSEAFTADTLPTWQEGVDMNLNWTPAPDTGSLMIVSLRYSNVAGSATPNVELSCAFADDGSDTIPGAWLDGWGAAFPASRSYVYIRFRERIVNVDDKTFLRLRSQYEQPLPPLLGAALRQ